MPNDLEPEELPTPEIKLAVPLEIEAVIQEFNERTDPFNEMSVQQALTEAFKASQSPSEAEKLGAWAEILAFSLTDIGNRNGGPWGTYFGPISSGTNVDGKTIYFPDIESADTRIVSHWRKRAKFLSHPVLKARYADLCWDMSTVIAKSRRDPEMARLAIDMYLKSGPKNGPSELYDRFHDTIRALDLAVLIHDLARTEQARASLIKLHRLAMDTKDKQWWQAVSRLLDDRAAGVTDEERGQLVFDLEELVLYFGDTATFDPHSLEAAANRLITHYTRLRQTAEVRRLHGAIARAFEHFASLANPMLASTVLQTSINAFRNAGLSEESKRVRILMQEKIGEARSHMGIIQTEMVIANDDLESLLQFLVTDDLSLTLYRIAANFLPNKKQFEEAIKKNALQAPVQAMVTHTIMEDDHVAAKIGSVENDPMGRLLMHASRIIDLSGFWLQESMYRAFETHDITASHMVSWTNRHGLFNDVTFLFEGVTAMYEGDLIKAIHVLVPQIEYGLRSIAGKVGKPVTKAHPTIPNVSVVLNMGDILRSDQITEVLGPDISLHFLSLYADPRGKNIRNQVAHGMLKPAVITESLVFWLIHSLLVFGAWEELARLRRVTTVDESERQFGVARKPGREDLLKRLRAFRGRLPADFKFDRDEANGR